MRYWLVDQNQTYRHEAQLRPNVEVYVSVRAKVGQSDP